MKLESTILLAIFAAASALCGSAAAQRAAPWSAEAIDAGGIKPRVPRVEAGISMAESGTGPAGVANGSLEPDYRFPWVVRQTSAGCGGVLIDPRWVLTAAHCVFANGVHGYTYRRTDPYNGTVYEQTRGPSNPTSSPRPGVVVHPDYDPSKATALNDIALVRLSAPFDIDPYIQTVGLPIDPTHAGAVGSLASFDHFAALPPGQVAVYRAPIPLPDGNDVDHKRFVIKSTDTSGWVCKGDSGSGFVTLENGRATVRGLASHSNAITIFNECKTDPSSYEAHFADVFAHRDFILQTMRTADYRIAGTTRVRWAAQWSMHGFRGEGARGVMSLGCANPYGTMSGPLDVRGAELGANCEPGQTQAVVCSIVGGSAAPRLIKGFSMKTTCAPHSPTVEALPFGGALAAFHGIAPAHPDSPFGVCLREFTCTIGPAKDEIWDLPLHPITLQR